MRKKSQNHDKEWMVYLSDTPIGPLRLYFSDQGLTALEFAGEKASPEPIQDVLPPHLQPLIDAAKRELKAYFEGSHTDFAALSLDPQGTPFQRRVWQELQRIPRGQTISYKELAQRSRQPQGLAGPWARPTAGTPSPSSSPAIGSLRRTAAWGASVRAWRPSAGSCAMKERCKIKTVFCFRFSVEKPVGRASVPALFFLGFFLLIQAKYNQVNVGFEEERDG